MRISIQKLRHMGEAFIAKYRIASAYQETFGHPAGQMTLRDILRRAGVLETSIVQGDAQLSAWKEGRRALALEIIECLRWNEMELLSLATERTADTLAQFEEQNHASH